MTLCVWGSAAPFLFCNFLRKLAKFEAPFSSVTPEPGLQCHASLKVGLCHVLSRPSPEEHDLRLLRRALFPGRCWAVSHAKNGRSTKGLPFYGVWLEKVGPPPRTWYGRVYTRVPRYLGSVACMWHKYEVVCVYIVLNLVTASQGIKVAQYRLCTYGY